jgi:hypothetical protein
MLEVVGSVMPRAEVEAVWAFPALRREGREYGAAVVSRVTGGAVHAAAVPEVGPAQRRRVYRARWHVQLKGQDRGRWSVELVETAEAPAATLDRVLEGVRRRADEAGEAEPLDLTAWKAGGGGNGDA